MPLTRPAPHFLDPDILESGARDVARAGAITFRVGDDAITYAVDGPTIRVDEGRDDGPAVVRLSRQAWDDMVNQVRTVINLLLSNDLLFERGGFEQLADWDPILRYLHAGIPPYDPARADLQGRDPRAVFTLAAGDDELAAQLRTMGYLHVRGVFGPDEMQAANREVDRLAAQARPGDDQSWWATAEDGTGVLCRLVYATLRSPVLAALENDPRVRRLGTLIDPALRAAPDRMEGSAVLLKAPGNTSGLSNIPWHQDCGMGGHAIMCPAASVGIQLTGSDPSTGNLQVVPGSHGQAIHYRWEQRLQQVPVVSIDTAPGDVTVHIQDLMHASPRPTGAGGRRTMYVTHYPPRLFDNIGPGQAFNDLVRNRTEQVARLQ
ncbi:phytanoyl-CoA dioxygenase family protein [Mycobacterium sp.]|uniref:phytanoyl-CoA dioxygenase family protein n=1 Tax=Mycobacterium sp. TaxID=1785 RepID=UPI002B68F9E0|nr:phytanoyl-CoA dioxygenase family protein [Mycobacterium sp.]HTY34136.1 phytanoyl-CoA dioxygenase family protein [Mycobacterium sp.]